MSKTLQFSQALTLELNKLLDKYNKRRNQAKEFESTKKSNASPPPEPQAEKVVTEATKDALPKSSSEIGGVAGFFYAMGIKIFADRKYKKLQNAHKVLNVLGWDDETQHKNIKLLVGEAIKERAIDIEKIVDTDKYKQRFSTYMAATMMKAIKTSGDDPNVANILVRTRRAKSKKVTSHKLKLDSGSSINAKDITQHPSQPLDADETTSALPFFKKPAPAETASTTPVTRHGI